MAAILIWLGTVGVGLVLLVVTAALKKVAFHAFICALISVNVVVLAMREHERRVTSASQQLDLMALNARYIGCNWAWMSLSVITMHMRALELCAPMTFAMSGLVAALVCFGFARLIVQAGKNQPERIAHLLGLAWFMSFVQFIGALVTLSTLAMNSISQDTRYEWPSLNIIAFSTVALAILSGRALVTLATRLPAQPKATARPLPAAPASR